MKIKTAGATPLQINWLVAKCEGWNAIKLEKNFLLGTAGDPSDFSESWDIGGPIIDREGIDCISDPNGRKVWMGRTWIKGQEFRLFGPTALIAAMRCYVASKLGDEVEIPEELA